MTDTPSDEQDALLSLLDTETGNSLALLLEGLRTFSGTRLRALAASAVEGSVARRHLDSILAEHQVPRMEAALLEWSGEGADLETGVLLVALTAFPQLNVDEVRQQLDAMAVHVKEQLPHGTEIQRLETLATLLDTQYGFRGNVTDYYDPDNSFINRVLERRTGLPITLTVLYILLGKRLDLAISGVPLPAHFIGCLATTSETVYFDPFHGGAVLSLTDITALVQAAGTEFEPHQLRSATSRQIVQRMFANLVHAYQEREDLEMAEIMRQYHAILSRTAHN